MGATIPASVLVNNNLYIVKNDEIIDYINESKVVGDTINANSATCFAEGDTTKNANEWMGITGAEFVKFTITKEISGTDFGTVSVSGVSANTISSSELTIPSYITNNGNRYAVTSISNNAFTDCSKLTGALTMPDTIPSIDSITIGDYAFYGCSGLTGALTIPNSVTSIGNGAFTNCFGLTGNLTISNSVTDINNKAFVATPISNVYILNSSPTMLIGSFIFNKSPSLTNNQIIIYVPKGAKVAWDETPNILEKLGIENLNQIVENKPETQPIDDFPWWAILSIVAGITILITVVTISAILIKRKK